MIGLVMLAISVFFGVSLGLHLHARSFDAARSYGRRSGAAFVLGIAAWSASALLDTTASIESIATGSHAWLRLVALIAVVAASFAGLRLVARPGKAWRLGAGAIVGIGVIAANGLNLVLAAGWHARPLDPMQVLLGGIVTLLGTVAGVSLYPVNRRSWIVRSIAALLFAGGCLIGAASIAGTKVHAVVSVLGVEASNTYVLLACAYASFLLLMLIERDARREADDLSASLVRANEDILSFEQRDPVTLLHHRAHFSRRVQALFEHVARRRGIAAVAVFGVEGLALVNDAYGASAGDEALRIVAGRLLARVRDDRAGRLGGGEFAAVLTRFHDLGELMHEIESMLDALSQPILIDDEAIHLSISAGVAVYPCDGEGILPLTRAAHAMQRAKRSGRNQVCVFDPALDCSFDRDLSVQNGLHRALSNGEFILHLQPKCDARTGQVLGAEALLRWDSPDGLIAPGDFIGVAERHGLIKDIGWFVIEEACRTLRRLRERGILLPLSVNLAPGQFADPGLIERLCETLARYGVSPGSLCLEITESMAVENAEHMAAVLRALRGLGFKVAVDDFGTGYSSLSKLVSLPVDELKLDRSFIVDIESDLRSRSIVQAVIELAHACGCIVVVEGVETRGQAALITQFGADQAQGFHWHRPMPCTSFIELVENGLRSTGRLSLVSAA